MNKVILVGNLGKDPEVRFVSDGTAVAQFPVATSERWTDKAGQKQEKTQWHTIVVWGNQAENCGKYLTKGRQVLIEGAIEYRSYEKDGVTKYVTEIKARSVQFLGGGKGTTDHATTEGEDIPF